MVRIRRSDRDIHRKQIQETIGGLRQNADAAGNNRHRYLEHNQSGNNRQGKPDGTSPG
jgi:hypothetical protein